MSQNLQYTLDLQRAAFARQMQGAINQVRQLDQQIARLNQRAINPGGQNGAMGWLKKAAIGGAIAYATGQLVSFEKAVVETYSKYEKFQASLTTLLMGNKNAAAALNGQLVQLAKTTPFSLEDVQAGTTQLLAYGVAAGDITAELKTIGDVAAGVGAPINDLIYLYGTLKTQGRAYAMDIRQFTGRGIPIIKELAKQFGVTTDKVNELVKDGKIGFKEIQAAFKTMTAEGGQFFNMMQAQSATIGGRLSNLGDSWDQLLVQIGRSQRGIMASTVSFVDGMLSKLGEMMNVSNNIDEAYAKHGAKQFTFAQNAGHTIYNVLAGANDATGGLLLGKNFSTGSAVEQQEKLQRALLSMYVNPSGRNTEQTPEFARQQLSLTAQLNDKKITQEQYQKQLQKMKDDAKANDINNAYKSLEGLYSLSRGHSKAFQNKEIDKIEYDRSIAQISEAIEKVKGNIDLAKSRGVDTNAVSSEPKKEDTIGKGLEEGFARPQNIYITINKLTGIENLTQNTNVTESAPEIKQIIAQTMLEAVNDVNNQMK